MSAKLCEGCPVAGSCGTNEVNELLPLGYRRMGSFIEKRPQVVLSTPEGGISQAFYLTSNKISCNTILKDEFEVLKRSIQRCDEPRYYKRRSFLGVGFDAEVVCGAVNKGYTHDSDGAPAIRFSEEQLRGSLAQIIARNFVTPARSK